MAKEQNKEEMTVSEAGRMGGEKRLEQIGPEGMSELGQKGGQHSWTADPEHAKVPQLTEEDRRRVEEIRAKQQRGEELTTAEAGFLGGVERVEQASKEGGGQR